VKKGQSKKVPKEEKIHVPQSIVRVGSVRCEGRPSRRNGDNTTQNLGTGGMAKAVGSGERTIEERYRKMRRASASALVRIIVWQKAHSSAKKKTTVGERSLQEENGERCERRK